MEYIRTIITLFFAAWFGIGAFLNLRNAFHHKHQQARMGYRVFIGGVALITSLTCLLFLFNPNTQSFTAVVTFGIIFSLGMCVNVIGWIEW